MSSIWVTTLWMYALAIAVSMGVAVVIKLIVVALGALERKPAQAPAALPAAAAVEQGVPAAHIAAIAAAIYKVIGEHRILHIADTHRHDGWVAEGRQALHHSHAVGHHPRR